jgi:hypothetical protein
MGFLASKRNKRAPVEKKWLRIQKTSKAKSTKFPPDTSSNPSRKNWARVTDKETKSVRAL